MGCRPAFAATQVNLFEGTCYLTPVLGAWLADAHWGRYKTILVFSGIYFVVRLHCRVGPFFPRALGADTAMNRLPLRVNVHQALCVSTSHSNCNAACALTANTHLPWKE